MSEVGLVYSQPNENAIKKFKIKELIPPTVDTWQIFYGNSR